ncbi:unnamed protein product, partial [Meganyctiphanes norvegica]
IFYAHGLNVISILMYILSICISCKVPQNYKIKVYKAARTLLKTACSQKTNGELKPLIRNVCQDLQELSEVNMGGLYNLGTHNFVMFGSFIVSNLVVMLQIGRGDFNIPTANDTTAAPL